MVLNKISGIGKYLPEKILTNHDLEKIVDTSDEWIVERTGIKERRISGDNELSSTMAAEALKRACEDASIDVKDIDFILCATNSPDMLFPSNAMKILKYLDIKDRPGIDLQAGCSGFCYGIELADHLLKSGTYKHIAVIGTEKLTSLIDWEDRNTCVLFGDGAGAVVVSKGHDKESGIISSYLGGDSFSTEAITMKGGMSQYPANQQSIKDRLHFVRMEGKEVFKFAVRVIPKAVKHLLKRAKMTIEDINIIIPHQANTRIVESAAKLLSVPMEKFYMNIHKYGNTSSASIPIALKEAVEDGALKRGDNVITVGFGAGLTYAANLFKY